MDSCHTNVDTYRWDRLWRLERDITFPVVGHCFVTIPAPSKCMNDHIVCFGGWDGRSYTNKTVLSSTEFIKSRVRNEKLAPPPRKDHTLTYSPYDDKIYLYGGWDPLQWDYENAYFSDVWSLDNQWVWRKEELLGVQPDPRRGHTAVFSQIPVPCLVVFGGAVEYNKLVAEVFVLNLNKKKWKKMKSSGNAPPPVAWHSSHIIKDKMYVIGGIMERDAFNQEIYVMNMNSFVWNIVKISKGKMEPRYAHSGITCGECIIILGGAKQRVEAERMEEGHTRTASVSTTAVSEGDTAIEHQDNTDDKIGLDEVIVLCIGKFEYTQARM